VEEGLVEVIKAYLTDEEASIAVQSGEGTFDDRMVTAELRREPVGAVS
jgi:hypothetical protein